MDLEAQDDWRVFHARILAPEAEGNQFDYHLQLLCDAGLMAQVGQAGFRMTNQGHDYLDAIRDDGIWRKTKNIVAETGGNATLEIVKSLAVGFLKKKIEQHTDIKI